MYIVVLEMNGMCKNLLYATSAYSPLIQVPQQVVIDKCAPLVLHKASTLHITRAVHCYGNPAQHLIMKDIVGSSSSRLHTATYRQIAVYRAKGTLFHPTTRHPVLLAIVSFHFSPLAWAARCMQAGAATTSRPPSASF